MWDARPDTFGIWGLVLYTTCGRSGQCLTCAKFRMPEDVPVGERTAGFQERFVKVGSTIEANTKTTEVVALRVSPFNQPAEFTETAAMFGATLRNHRLDAALAQSLTMRT